MSKYPIVTLPNSGPFILSHTALAASLSDGLRHVVLSAALEGRLPGVNETQVGGAYGDLVEEYALRVLRKAFGPDVYKIPEDSNPGRADFLISLPSHILVIEMKSGSYRALEHYALMSLIERQAEATRIGVEKAVQQVAATINDLAAGEFRKFVGLRDWTVTPFVPIVVSAERIPVVPATWERVFRLFEDPLHNLDTRAVHVGRLRMMTLSDLEMLPDIPMYDIGRLLMLWGRDPQRFEYSFKNYLDATGVSLKNPYMDARFRATQDLHKSVLESNQAR